MCILMPPATRRLSLLFHIDSKENPAAKTDKTTIRDRSKIFQLQRPTFVYILSVLPRIISGLSTRCRLVHLCRCECNRTRVGKAFFAFEVRHDKQTKISAIKNRRLPL